MAVTRSPFVNPQRRPTGYGTDEEGNQTYTDSNGVTTITRYANQMTSESYNPKENKTSIGEEKNKLNKVLAKAAGVAAKMPMNPLALKDIVGSLRDLGTKGTDPKTVGKGLLGTFGNTIKYAAGEGILQGIEQADKYVLAPVRRTVLSAFQEGADVVTLGLAAALDMEPEFQSGPRKGERTKASLSEFWEQANRVGFNPYGPEGDLRTGKKKTDKVLAFTADVLADPTTYFTLPASQASKAHKIALASRVATELMPKYPELVMIPNLLDNVARYGPTEIPDHIRKAENIFVGVKWMGEEIPNSSAFAKAWRHTLGEASAQIGDAFYKKAPWHQYGITRRSIKPLVAGGIGRGRVKTNDEFFETYLGGLADFSAASYGRGARGLFEGKSLGAIQQTLRQMDDFTAAEIDEVYKIIETRTIVASNPKIQGVVDQIRTWDDAQRDAVIAAQKTFGNRWNTLVNEMGFIDDHLYHSLTPEARQWMIKEGYKSKFKDIQDFTISAADLLEGNGISSYRKLRKATYNPDGSLLHAEKFLGEDVIHGTIEEINEKSLRLLVDEDGKSLNIKWFETDSRVIVKNSVKSYGKMIERIKYYDRVMEFGPSIAKPLIKSIVKDPALVAGLVKIVDDLVKVQTKLAGRVKRGPFGLSSSRDFVSKELDETLLFAQSILDGKLAEGKAVDAAINDTIKEIDLILNTLQDTTNLAKTKSADLKGEFDDVAGALIRELESLRAAAATPSGAERFVALKELRKEYIKFYPDANDMEGKSAEWLAERIVRAAGGDEVVDARLAQNIKDGELLRAWRDSVPAEDLDVVAKIDEKIIANDLQLEAISRIAAAKSGASYATHGLIYGFPPVSGEPVPFQVFSTQPLDNEFSTFDRLPDAIVGHAIPESELLDIRNPVFLENFINPDYWVNDFNQIWNAVGVPNYIDANVVAKMVEMKGVLDPEYIKNFPLQAELLDGFYKMHQKSMLRQLWTSDEEIVNVFTHRELEGFFDWYDDLNQRIAHKFSPDNSDAVGRSVTHNWFKLLVDSGAEYNYKGTLVPLGNLFGDAAPTGNDWAVLMPARTPTPKVGTSIVDPWQFMNENAFMKNALDGVMENHHLASLDKAEMLRKEGIEVANNIKARTELDEAITQNDELTVVANELVALRNSDSVMVNGVPVKRDVVVKRIAALDAQFAKAYDDINRQIEREIEAKFGVKELETQRLKYEQRLPMLFNEAAVLETWTEGTGAGLAQEIQDMILLITAKPAKGSTAASNASWTKHVYDTMNSSSLITEAPVRAAYDRITTMLHADEVALAKIDGEITTNFSQLLMAEAGTIGKLVNEMAEKGWTEIANLGIQMPDEVLKVWGPNLKKLGDIKEANGFAKVIDATNNYWKRYVTSSVGFFVRNGMSGMFMNYADGVTNSAIYKGLKWASFQNETTRGIKAGRNFSNWIDRAKITDPAEIAQAEWVTQVVLATGHGVTDDFAVPTAGRLSVVNDNRLLRFFSRKNKFTERALRLPMAIDSFNKNHTFDEAVARINRIHFDYSDLSKLDQYAKRVVPFWIWTSRNIPLQISQITTRPKAYYEYKKVKEQFPLNPDLIMPRWIQDREPMQAMANWVFAPDLPHLRLFQQLKAIGTLEGLLGNATPIIKVPLEVLAYKKQVGIKVGPFNAGGMPDAKGYEKPIGKLLEFLTGNKLVTYDKQGNMLLDARVNYVIEQFLPLLGQFNRVTGGKFGGKDSLDERMMSSILNWWGIPLRYIGPEQERGEIIRRRYEGQDALDDLENELNKLRGQQRP